MFNCITVKEVLRVRVKGTEPCRVVVVGDTCVSEEGMAVIVGRNQRYHVCGGAHGFFDAGELIRKHQPEVLLIEPFLEDRDGICWVAVVGDSCISEPALAAILGRDKRYHFDVWSHGFYDARQITDTSIQSDEGNP